MEVKMHSLILKKLSLRINNIKRIIVIVVSIAIIFFDYYCIKNILLENFSYQFIENNNKIYVINNIYQKEFIKNEWIKKNNNWYYVTNDCSLMPKGIHEINEK